jgi:hypothetical protein
VKLNRPAKSEIRSLVVCLCVIAVVLATPGLYRRRGFIFNPGLDTTSPADRDPGGKRTHQLAEKGDPAAQFRLGAMYASGIEVAKNPAEALRWYLKAAEQGHAAAQFNLGLIYKVGDATPPNPAESLKWFRKAAGQNIPEAQYFLGSLYETGSGVPANYPEAAKWYRLAAEQGNSLAQYNLAAMCDSGEGIPKDKIQAAKWARLAAASGVAQSAKMLERMEKEMTQKEIGNAKKLAAEFKPRRP